MLHLHGLEPAKIARELDEHGLAIIEDVLDPADCATIRARLWEIVGELSAAGVSTHTPIIDPNAHNVRVYDLPDHDPAFVRLLTDEAVTNVVDACFGSDSIVSNFSANIARPGARAMKMHSDQALVIPGPWIDRWALNVIWCLDEASAANGATRYLPGSHRYTTLSDVPADAEARMQPIEAPAGAAIVLDGRTWHSSGDNVTADQDRALLFAYYSRSFIRPQVCWHEALRPQTVDALDARQRKMFGLGALANVHGVSLIALG